MIALPQSYDEAFCALLEKLRADYPAELFRLEGIHPDQLDINTVSRDFFKTSDRKGSATADHSIDPNANVSGRDVITFNYEVPKSLMKLNSLYNLWRTMKELYGQDEADHAIAQEIGGAIYINDVWDIGRPYCFNFSTYDIALEGLKMGGRLTIDPPKSLNAFLRQVEQFTVYAANSTLGATGLADLLIVVSRYVDDILSTGHDHHVNIGKDARVWTYVRESLTSLIYTLNWEFRGNQCVTEDTEVLTPSGFKTLDTLKEGDDIYTWKNGDMNINKVQRINSYPYEGLLHSYKGRDIEQVVTPNHRVLYKTGSNPYKLTPSEHIFNLKSPLTFPVAMNKTREKDYPISDAMLDLVTLILTDGSIEDRPGKSPRVSWSKAPTRWGEEHFKKVCEECDLHYTESVQKSEWGGRVNVKRFSVEESQRILAHVSTKRELPSWFFKLSRRQAERVINLWAKTDGYQQGSRIKLQADNSLIADHLQHLCFLAGKGSRITSRLIGSNKTPTLYVIPYSRTSKDANIKEAIHYKGRVWCPTTEDGIVVFRKNGKIFISGNSPFTNVSVYDRPFLEELAPAYRINGKAPDIATVEKVQDLFLEAMNQTLARTPVTFPVVTACLSCTGESGEGAEDGEDAPRRIRDEAFLKKIARHNLRFGFINLYCGASSTLSSCCRLRSSLTDLGYSNTFGAGGTKIGSLGVVTLNLPRLARLAEGDFSAFLALLRQSAGLAARINHAKRAFIRDRIRRGSLPLYALGFMDLSRQYSTCGFTGLYEALAALGLDMRTEEGLQAAEDALSVINETNARLSKALGTPHNMEQVPAESSAVKLAKKDALLGFNPGGIPLYSNQFLPLWEEGADLLDRIRAQGRLDGHCTGGAICHLNIAAPITDPAVMEALISHAASCGAVYFAVNYQINRCAQGHMSVGRAARCPLCGEAVEDTFTRVVGFLTNTKHWNRTRREHDWPERTFA